MVTPPSEIELVDKAVEIGIVQNEKFITLLETTFCTRVMDPVLKSKNRQKVLDYIEQLSCFDGEKFQLMFRTKEDQIGLYGIRDKSSHTVSFWMYKPLQKQHVLKAFHNLLPQAKFREYTKLIQKVMKTAQVKTIYKKQINCLFLERLLFELLIRNYQTNL